MSGTIFHRRVLTLDVKDSTTSAPAATLAVDTTGIEVVALDGNPVTTDDKRKSFFVDIRRHATKNLQLTFNVPKDASTATYQVGTGTVTTMTGSGTTSPNFSVVSTMENQVVTCSLAWSDAKGSVTITVRPRSSTDGADGDLYV
jgi:hypothetical protein